MQTAQFLEAAAPNAVALSTGLLITRLVFGAVISAHGAQKLFGWFGGYGLAGTGKFFEQIGFRPGRLFAAAASVTEIVAGILIALGFLGPVGPALMLSVMLVAGITVRWGKGLLGADGIELPLLYAAAAVGLAFTGPGLFSLDALLGLEAFSSPTFVALALAAGIVGGIGNISARRPAPSNSAVTAT